MVLKEFLNMINKKNIDLAIIMSLDESPNTSMVYFTGYRGIGILAFVKDKKPFLLVPEMEYEKALKSGMKIIKAKRRMLDNLADLLKGVNIRTIGIEEYKCNIAVFKRLKKTFKGKYSDISPLIRDLRYKKSNDEIKKIARACSITDEVLKDIVSDFRFKTENELKLFMENRIREKGCDLAFPAIVASASGSSEPHYESSGKLKKGFLLLDFGAKYDGYCADMTRMLYLGKPTPLEIENYELLKNCVLECEKAALVKKTFGELHNLSVDILGKNAKYFIHSLGHGLGLDIHEFPSVTKGDKTTIEENIPFTIEPGIYFPGKYGIRIEDTLVIQNGKVNVLTKSSKELVLIDF